MGSVGVVGVPGYGVRDSFPLKSLDFLGNGLDTSHLQVWGTGLRHVYTPRKITRMLYGLLE